MSSEPHHRVLERLRSAIARSRRPVYEHDEWGNEQLARGWGIEACDVCGRTILLGEATARFTSGDHVMKVCPVCEGSALSQGYQRAA